MRLVYQTFDFCCAVRSVFTQTPHPQQIFGQVALNYEAMALQQCRIGSPIFTKVPAGLCWSLKSRLNESTWSDSAWKSWLSRFLRWGCEVPVAKSRVKFRRASLPLSWSSTLVLHPSQSGYENRFAMLDVSGIPLQNEINSGELAGISMSMGLVTRSLALDGKWCWDVLSPNTFSTPNHPILSYHKHRSHQITIAAPSIAKVFPKMAATIFATSAPAAFRIWQQVVILWDRHLISGFGLKNPCFPQRDAKEFEENTQKRSENWCTTRNTSKQPKNKQTNIKRIPTQTVFFSPVMRPFFSSWRVANNREGQVHCWAELA